MAEIEKISDADRMEQAGLERAVADIEREVLASPPGTRPLFNGFLLNAKARLGVLEKKIHDEEREERDHATNEIALVSLAQSEAALSAKEKETYDGFLKKEFFTKRDFAKLDEFYAHSWDRLSESGKDQMSHRIWEGIRRDEYKFTELPKSVQEKEAKRAYDVVKRREVDSPTAARIPDKDRDDFIRAYEAGKQEEAKKVLERDSFKKNMFRESDSTEIKHANVELGKGAAAKGIEKGNADVTKSGKDSEVHRGGEAGIDLSGLNLDSVKMAEAPKNISSADIAASTKGVQSPVRG